MQHTILSGDKETAVSIIKVTEELDAGDILAQERTTVGYDETYPELHDRLAVMGANMLVHLLDDIDAINLIPQSEEGITYAAKLPNSIELD